MDLKPDAPLTFQDRLVPRGTRLAGLAALVKGLGLAAPVRVPSAVAEGHIRGSRRTNTDWTVFDKRYWPGDKVTEHLSFALRHEPIDLLILKRAFDAIPAGEIAAFIRAAPTGTLTRRAWFFCETLTGTTLDIEDAETVTAAISIPSFRQRRRPSVSSMSIPTRMGTVASTVA